MLTDGRTEDLKTYCSPPTTVDGRIKCSLSENDTSPYELASKLQTTEIEVYNKMTMLHVR